MVRHTVLGERCPIEVDFPCQPRRYRAFSGYCNNVQNPKWGNANTKFLRFLPADYANGVSSLRGSSTGNPLPSARDVSARVHLDSGTPHTHVTSLLAVWLQFISHDIAHISQAVGIRGRRLKCCNVEPDELHPECAPITISNTDPFYGPLGVTCLDYIRSCTGPRTGCMLGPREQVNQVTAFLDASSIYGSSQEEADDLRAFYNGLLKTQTGEKGLLPIDENLVDCKIGGAGRRCFKSGIAGIAGDIRVNEHLGLVIMHTIWVREHNRVASAFRLLNPHWDDETLFQQTRHLVAAEMQHIHYSEVLPLLLGPVLMSQLNLNVERMGYSSDYNVDVNPGINSAIASAVLRLVLSLLPPHLGLYSPDRRILGRIPISSTSYAPFSLYDKGKLDGYLIGLMQDLMQNGDADISSEFTRRLFGAVNGSGLDGAASAIQQGRDHGIAGYTKWRAFCGLPEVNSFDGFKDVMSVDIIARFTSVYATVDDVDLFSGGLAEIPISGAILGPTFACIIGRQFQALRRGDRYWFENDMPPSSFTKEQLAELHKSSLSRIICDNADKIDQVQPNVFVQTDPFLNAIMKCSADMIPTVNLEPWKQSNRLAFAANVIADYVEQARQEVEVRKSNEHQAFLKRNGVASEKSPIGIHLGFVRPKREAISISNTSIVLQFASQGFVSNFLQGRLKDIEYNSHSLRNVEELMKILPTVDISDFVDIPRNFECDEQTLPCDHTSRFRTFTGLCNNLRHPTYGKSYKAFQRLLPPVYDDNLSEPRSKSKTGSPLPSARLISISVHSDSSRPHSRYTLMTMQFGQFVDHDLTHTPVHTGFQGAILDCSRCDSQSKIHPECLPIPIPKSDPYFPPNSASKKSKCLSFVRSLPGQLTMGPREQINQITAFVDCSHIYGSDLCDAKKLRSFSQGQLNITRNPAGKKDLLPETNQNKECKSLAGLCFDAGDKRASEQVGLAAMHTLFLREHNRIAKFLSKLNPQWDDETLYQNGRNVEAATWQWNGIQANSKGSTKLLLPRKSKLPRFTVLLFSKAQLASNKYWARRIVTAMNQHIVYGEFLPRVMGWAAVHQYELDLSPEGFYDKYDPNCNPAIFNEFATAAFRFGHSLIKPFMQRLDGRFSNNSNPLQLRHQFFNPDKLYKVGMIDEIMRGLATTSMETLDQFITSEVTNHLFEDSSIPFSGLDLVALNLQRGREHGIATYNQMRQLCQLKSASSFDDLAAEIPVQIINKLKAIYRHVDDIDLFTGGLSEISLEGALVGPTFACILGHQFRQLRMCDRFWYETSDPLLRFTEDQLMEIRQVKLSKILCQNSDSIDLIQKNIFDQPDDFMNPRVSCSSLPEVNLNLWADRRSCTIKQHTIPIGSAKRISPCVMCTCTSEGPTCQSIKIANCLQLISSFDASAILRDQVCKVQCAFVFRASSHLKNEEDNIFGISS
uniref:Peroxidase n=1 Tax=Strigamia maritima TaxID=126957 RepID=T1IHP0_STRMM